MEELEEILGSLANDAKVQEDAAFDPSGSHVPQEPSSSDDSWSQARSWHGEVQSEDTSLTDLSEHLRSFLVNQRHDHESSDSDQYRIAEATSISAAGAEAELIMMFPTIKAQDVSFIFQKTHGDIDRSIEELLNHAFFADETSNRDSITGRRGLEAFDISDVGRPRKSRKGKSRRKQPLRRTSSTPGYEDDSSRSGKPPMNRWNKSKEDVEFITQRTHIPEKIVTSLYHGSGGSLATTIFSLLEHQALHAENPYLDGASTKLLEEHAHELRDDFPTLGDVQAVALIRLTHPSTASAHELAMSMSSLNSSGGSLQPAYSPFTPSPPSTPRVVPTTSAASIGSSASPANLYAAKSHAQNRAAAAYRASRSGKPLMAQAAGYHSSVARSTTASLLAQDSAAADARVKAQSKPGEIDLHGLNVRDAVRVALHRTVEWWDQGAREWAREGKVMGNNGLRIIVGIGRHSEGGKGRLGPAVGKALLAEGWKAEIGQGVLTVVGRTRK